MISITEKEFKEYCKDCYTPKFHIVLGEASNTPEYLRRYFELLGKKEYKELEKKYKNLCKLWHNKFQKEKQDIFNELDKICIPVPSTDEEMEELANEYRDFEWRIMLISELNKLKKKMGIK